MKKSIFALIIAIIALIASGIALGVIVTTPGQTDQPVSDSISAVETPNIMAEPVFITKGDILGYYELEWNKRIVDSVFMSIPYTALENVAAVVTGQLPECTKKDIVLEYLKNSNVYKFLGPTETPPDITVENIIATEDSAPAHDTIIDGIKYKKIE